MAQIGQVPDGGGQSPMPLHWLAFAPDGHTLFGIARNGSDVLAWDVPKVSEL